MPVRTHLLLRDPPLQRRLRRLLHDRGVAISADNGRDPPEEAVRTLSADVCIVRESLLASGVEPLADALRGLGRTPDLVVLTRSSDPAHRARIAAQGACAVLGERDPDDVLRDALTAIVREHADRLRLPRPTEGSDTQHLGDFVSSSPAMERLLRVARRVAAADSTVLITGETGVGKEWLARAIHTESPRVDGPFVAVNCSAMPDTLVESELFGHEEGAFTDARRRRRGRFELADGGTIFLDEIGDMPPHVQAKLLRVLQERELQRVGGEESIRIDVRVLAATNIDLERAVAEGSFRADLFYRLAVVVLELPPLRERPEDVPALIERYVAQFARALGRGPMGVDPDALERLLVYDWPGNVRELANVVERAVLLADGPLIRATDLPEKIAARRRAPERLPVPDASAMWIDRAALHALPWTRARDHLVDAFAREYFEAALRRHGGHIGDTARATGLNPRSLYAKLRQLGLDKKSYRPGRENGAVTEPGG